LDLEDVNCVGVEPGVTFSAANVIPLRSNLLWWIRSFSPLCLGGFHLLW
jgi:hypothetical protein